MAKNYSDIINSKAYKISELTISLILFVDDVQFNKSSSNKIYSIQAQIAELPPKVRCSTNNIICFLFYIGGYPNFNILFDKYLVELKNILKDGLFCESIGKKIFVRIHACVADAPARAKVSNSKQFNGEYGCLHCLNPGVNMFNKRIYEYKDYPPRTNQNYLEALIFKNINNLTDYEGIKGDCFLSEFCPMPDCFIIDYMHLSLEGTYRSIISIWIDKNNHHRKDYYIGNTCLIFLKNFLFFSLKI